MFHENENQNKSEVAALISEKQDFKTKIVRKDKKGHYIVIKGWIHHKNIAL